MKIGFVVDDTLDKPDGVQQYVLSLGGWLTVQGHEIHYLVGESKRTDVSNIHSLTTNVKVKFNGNGLSTPKPASRKLIRALIEREQFDVLHVQMPYSPLLAGRVVAAAPVTTAVVGTFHILPYTPSVRLATKALGRWLRPTLRRFDGVFAVSDMARDFAMSSFGLTDVSVLPNVVDLSKFQGARPLEQYDDDVVTIMFLGRLVPRKGCATLLDAVAIVSKESDTPFRIVVCGKGPLDADLKAQAWKLGIADRVEFTGFIDEADKPRYLASADIMAFPSSAGESFGIVLIEAMAAGRPVVLAGDNPGYRTVMAPKPELLFKPGDAAELAAKLRNYIEHATDRSEVRTWQSMYVRQFDVAVVGRRLLNRYAEVLRKRRRA